LTILNRNNNPTCPPQTGIKTISEGKIRNKKFGCMFGSGLTLNPVKHF
jgi:hypothetical protein